MFWRRKGEFDGLEARLRADRPEPRGELVESVRAAVEMRPRTTYRALRIGLAAALTLTLVVALFALGAASRSTAAASNVITFVQTGSFSKSSAPSAPTTSGTGTSAAPSSTSATSADDQYEEKVTICHRTSASDSGNTLQLSPSGAANHLQSHEYDYAGPCNS